VHTDVRIWLVDFTSVGMCLLSIPPCQIACGLVRGIRVGRRIDGIITAEERAGKQGPACNKVYIWLLR